MLLAVLDRRGGVPMGEADVFVNVAGGIRITEPAADLGLALSIVSNRHSEPLPDGLAVVGELGLAGGGRGGGPPPPRPPQTGGAGVSRALISARPPAPPPPR